MEGVLIKWTNYIEFWKERRFTIKGPILSYYVPENKTNKPKRRIFLGLADIIEPELEEGEEDDFGFEIDTGAEHYYIKANSKEEKQKWLSGLKNGKRLGEKLIRDSNKVNDNSKNDNKFEKFKRIYKQKIRPIYKNNKMVLKQFDNIINFIEGKDKFIIYKPIYKKGIINTSTNANYPNSKTLKVTGKTGRLTHIPNQKINEKIIGQNPDAGRLTVSDNNFTKKGYLLKGEEFFDMDESSQLISEDEKEINKFKSNNSHRNKKVQKINENRIKTNNLIDDNTNNKNVIKSKNSKQNNKDKKGAYYDPLYEYEKRTSLPEKCKEVSINVFKILKDAIGKDLNHFAMPVTLNEPLSALQKLCEKFQYVDLINKAAKEPNPHLRLAYVAVFNIAGITMNIHRAKKLFNPLLHETYEYVDNKLNYRFFAEQVSHHPAISAYYAEGEGWNLYSNSNSKINISITGYVEVQNLEKTYLNFTNFSEEVTFSKPASKVRNILTDPILDIINKFWVKNSDGDECLVNMIPYNGNNKIGDLNGEVKDNEGNIVYKIEGNWCEKIKIINMKNKEEKVIWEIIKSCDKDNFYFQPYTFDLNNLTEEMKNKLPKTDSRFRGDQRLMEYQKFDEAGEEKNRLEEKQRAKRKENEKNGIHPVPRYFEETYDDITGELIYKYKGTYFEDRKNNNFKDLPDLFG